MSSRSRARKPIVLSDYDQTQKLTFTAWVNSYLRKTGERMDDIAQFADGLTLITFVRNLTGEDVNGGKYKTSPRIRIQIVENIQLALKHIEDRGIRVTCDPDNFLVTSATDVRMVLGFLWLLICKYQINAIAEDSVAAAASRAAAASTSSSAPTSLADRMARRRSRQLRNSSSSSSEGRSSGTSGGLAVPRVGERAVSLSQSMAGTQSLLQWVASELKAYSITVTNFGSCFQDGRAFCALTELAAGADAFNYAGMSLDDPVRSMSNAFATADMELDIPQLLVPEAVVKAPDPHSIMTYVSYFRAHLAGKRAAERTAKIEAANAALAAEDEAEAKASAITTFSISVEDTDAHAAVAAAAPDAPTTAPVSAAPSNGGRMYTQAELDAKVAAAVEAHKTSAAASAAMAAQEARQVQMDLLSEKERMSKRIEELMVALRAEQAAHVASNNEAGATLKELRAQVTAAKAAAEPLAATNTQLENKLSETATKAAGFKESLKVVEKALESKTRDANAAHLKLIDVEAELEAALEKIATLESQNSDMSAELSQSQSAISMAKAESKKLAATSQLTLQEAHLRINELEASLEQYRTALVDKSKSRKALKEALIAERKKNSELAGDVEAIRTAAEKYRAKLKVSKKLLKVAQEKANSVKAKNRLLGDRLMEVKTKNKEEKRKAKENEIKTIAAREVKVKGAVMGELERQRMELIKRLAQAKYQRSATPTNTNSGKPGSRPGSRRSSVANAGVLPVTPSSEPRRRSLLSPQD
ncbi:cortexillin-1 [Thecamonas trahens ATCC 50062]|uniref:Cortexillin-1 n=1 Tax=Thecamonas trahens ATCC 50062 TaxID=461836 RepID=A0A0L0DNK1_THETB|nr:cortexillin-1 [Thecamonas trahens ATCC 50062]KNC53845.1 cortexillin-1 [Thecamonas trahens ATCC 50062]|eukprot:XP_013754226.1 cortexillin-1 [Thecamonas trahens ATCC 50062]